MTITARQHDQRVAFQVNTVDFEESVDDNELVLPTRNINKLIKRVYSFGKKVHNSKGEQRANFIQQRRKLNEDGIRFSKCGGRIESIFNLNVQSY